MALETGQADVHPSVVTVTTVGGITPDLQCVPGTLTLKLPGAESKPTVSPKLSSSVVAWMPS